MQGKECQILAWREERERKNARVLEWVAIAFSDIIIDLSIYPLAVLILAL